ncbi:ABC transporter substrate-binding protein [Nocardioides marmoribigeumensis]|uniref:Multiple sugar transport system substrate-binding protein n=1 Tax=Nocardioides marmoribigeumensis TaxID=433649 RepID=A0ABU2BX82_9ACTN|nr:ABC transporter substrate-binding protein [Nocardioides marmoribigeumensis]MDR7363007.1 multiple sugar transport system substrate-binding protein [Nocardioides marmoribigeumensis]
MSHKRHAGLIALALAVAPLAACGGGDSGGGSGGGGGGAFDKALDSRGPITYVQGKDNSGLVQPLIDAWNKDHPDEKVTLKEQTVDANQQHDDLVRNFDAKNADYDVVSVDVVWTAEFAAKGYLQPLKDKMAIDTSAMLKPTVDAATYNGTLYAGPVTSDGGMLYYRSDLVKTPPKSWDDMMGMCSIAKKNKMDCYAGQFAKYEGLTVNAAEAINTAGGTFVSEDGKKSTVDSSESAKGLDRLVQAFKDGNIPAAAIGYKEEEGRLSFEAGKLLFLRNWPYVYSLASTDASSKVKGKFAVAPLPGDDGSAPGASSLGGHNAAISAFSDHKATALDFIKYLESDGVQRQYLLKASNAPCLAALYDDPELQKKVPYLKTLGTSIGSAVPRPVTPFYPAVTQAISDNAYAALKGSVDTKSALSSMAQAIDGASSGG